MFQVSDAFKLAALQPVQIHRITGTIGNVSFSENNIVDGSFSINNQSTDTSDVVLGSCYVGQLNAEFTGISGISYGNWINKTITPTFGLKVGDDWENVPLGVFKIKEAKHTEHGVQVVAYDNMIKFDKKFKKSHFMNLSGMYNIISQLCTDSGVILGMTQAQIEALPNGDRTGINIYGSKGKKSEFANDITTNRDLLFWVAQTLGCFATMNRAGQLEFRQYTQNVVDAISNYHRIEGATFADYITHYIGIYVENLDDNTEDYYGYDTTALTTELNETSAEISADNTRIDELVDDLAEWDDKLAHGQCTQEEYDAAVAEITAELHPLEIEVKQLNKRLAWLEKALQSGGDDGSDMVLGANPLVMAKNLTTRDAQRREILDALNAISYTPFNASVVCGCIYDLGDVIRFSGGLYNSDIDSFGCVMSYTYTHNGGTELEGYGVDPAIPMIRTKEQKETDRAQRNTYDSAKSTVGTIDPSNPPTADDSVPGKNGDMYVQETHKTPKTNVSKTFSCWETYYGAQNNLYWYSYDKVKITCDKGNFIICAARTTQSGRTWVVAGSKSRKIEWVRAICKVPVGAQQPTFTCEVSDVEEFNSPPPPPFEQVDPGGFGDETGTAFSYNGQYVENTAHTYRYYYATFGLGTWVGSLKYEDNEPDYVFENTTALENALKADEVTIPEMYDGADTNHVYYNDGSGSGDSSWKKVATVSNVSESDDAGGTENNGMVIDQTTQEIALKKNVVRAWYKADPPQTERKFSQLCVRYTGSPDKQVAITAYGTHVWHNSKITKDDDSVFKLVCKGTYESGQSNYAVYAISGLVSGKTYYFNFKCDFSNNATFSYDMSVGCGIVFNDTGTLSTTSYSGDEDTYNATTKYYAFKRSKDPWYADFGVVATASTMYMCVLMQGETYASSDVTFTISELVISQKERQLIRNIYLYDYTAKAWLKYKPFSGSTSGGDEGGSVVAIEPTLTQGTKIADFSIDGETGSLYAPNGGSISELDDVDIEDLANGEILKYNSTTEKWENAADTGGADAVEITWAAYQALPAAQKADPTKVYYVTDYPASTESETHQISVQALEGTISGTLTLKKYASGIKKAIISLSTTGVFYSVTLLANGTVSSQFLPEESTKLYGLTGDSTGYADGNVVLNTNGSVSFVPIVANQNTVFSGSWIYI